MGYGDIPLWLSLVFVIGGFAALAWSSDLFVDGAAALARAFGISPFIVGMVIIGFGTSAPELCVSAMSGLSGHAHVSLGNAYGSCIFNITAILGIASLIRPIVVKRTIITVAVPILALLTVLSAYLLRDGACSRAEALLLLAVFAVVMPFYCWYDQKANGVSAKSADEADPASRSSGSLTMASVKMLAGLAILIASSHFLVWGSVDLARTFGVSELVIGLTIVAIGTSLPELASAVASARRGEHEFVLGNIVGSNLFNTLAVVGVASSLSPFSGCSRFIIMRDLPAILCTSLSIALFGANFRSHGESGRINRLEGLVWIFVYVVYTILLFRQEVGA